MAARHPHPLPCRVRGSAFPKILIAVLVLGALGAGGWYFFLPEQTAPEPVQKAVTQAGDATAPAAAGTSEQAAPTSEIDNLSVDQLFKEARTALNQQRLVAPPKNNALEFYLKILEKEPGNARAQDALRELFQFAASSAEQAINGRNIEEAQRVIELLSKADSNNYTLTILRSKLDAQRKVVEREQQQAQAQQEAAARRADQQAAASRESATSPAAPTANAPRDAAPASTPSATPAAGAATAAATPAVPAPTAPATARPEGETRDAQLIRQAAVAYPQAAFRRREEGWVQVEFTVTADGTVANAHVIDSQPARVFDRAALDAVARWSFSPALRNGQAVESTMRRRIEFKLGGG